MKKDLYNCLKGIENLEVKSLRDLENLKIKSNKFKQKLNRKPESIENRLKIIILEKIIESIDQEKFVFARADKK